MFSNDIAELPLLSPLIKQAGEVTETEQIQKCAQKLDEVFDSLYQNERFKEIVIQSDEELEMRAIYGCNYSAFALAYRAFYTKNLQG
jgi:L-lactate utilization protein LutC